MLRLEKPVDINNSSLDSVSSYSPTKFSALKMRDRFGRFGIFVETSWKFSDPLQTSTPLLSTKVEQSSKVNEILLKFHLVLQRKRCMLSMNWGDDLENSFEQTQHSFCSLHKE